MTADTTQPATEIPTDPGGLYDYLSKLTPGEQCEVADRLAVQLGGTPGAIERACDLVDQVLQEIANGNAIVRERATLAEHITAASNAVAAAQASLRALSGDLYDVEYAEGGQRVWDLRDFLDDGGRMLRAAAAVNPCPGEKNGAA